MPEKKEPEQYSINMSTRKTKVHKIIKEWNEASPKEVWEGTRDNFIFGFLGFLYFFTFTVYIHKITFIEK